MDNGEIVVTWERSQSHGYTQYRSRDTSSRWVLALDADGWGLSQDGTPLEWHGDLDEAMTFVATLESMLGSAFHGNCVDRSDHSNVKQDRAGAWEIPLLDKNHADLEIRNGDNFELRFLDAPGIGATLVAGYYPGSWPWFGCISKPTVEDMATVNSLIEEGQWQVTRMSDRWGMREHPLSEADVDTDAPEVGPIRRLSRGDGLGWGSGIPAPSGRTSRSKTKGGAIMRKAWRQTDEIRDGRIAPHDEVVWHSDNLYGDQQWVVKRVERVTPTGQVVLDDGQRFLPSGRPISDSSGSLYRPTEEVMTEVARWGLIPRLERRLKALKLGGVPLGGLERLDSLLDDFDDVMREAIGEHAVTGNRIVEAKGNGQI